MDPEAWWRTAVVYQIYLRSFADGSGDGVGDIAGIRSRLPYLADLGVDALWINPWYPSGQVDGGYDVVDHRGVDPVFGTMADAEALLAEAHDRGLRVILDIVPNHTSDRHRWFRAALAAGPGSKERARYVFRPGRGGDGGQPPTNWRSVFGGPGWTRLPDGEWYLHLFHPGQPDLNWENPQVHEEFADTLRFWFCRGVDGFRVDVAHGLAKDPRYPDLAEGTAAATPPFFSGHPATDQEGVHEIYRAWRRIADGYSPRRVFVGEAWVRPLSRLARYVRPDELHTAFNFEFLRVEWDAAQIREVVDSTVRALGAVGAPPTWVLSNHDVVRHVTRYGRAAGHQNDRSGAVTTDLVLGARRARAAALLQLALPGSAYVYQGDELGLPEVEDLPTASLRDPVWERSGHSDRGRDGARVPLPWAGSVPPFGFGGCGSWLPAPSCWQPYTVEAQDGDPTSMLALYRAALRLRRSVPVPGDAPLSWLGAPDGVLSFTRWSGFGCLVNLGSGPVPLPAGATVMLTSGPLQGSLLPVDCAAWLRTS